MPDSAPEELTNSEVAHVAKLARIALSEDEIAAFGPQLASILEYVAQLRQVDLAGVQPLTNPLEVTNVLRTDEVGDTLSRDAALANAPQQDGTYFLVPEILESES